MDIDKARMARQQTEQRSDVGGEHGYAPPARPTFVSRPQSQAVPTQNSPVQRQQGGGPTTTYGAQGAIPTERYIQTRAVG
jgi:hypothetical protein